MRTFVAVELSEACRRKLERAQEELRPACRSASWVRPHGIHLTLKFIGELREADLEGVTSALNLAAAEARPFRMRVSGISGFPMVGRPRVITAQVEEPTGALAELAEGVEQRLCEALGITREKRPFRAHVTLGRVRDPKGCPSVSELSGMVTDPDFGEVDVDGIVLLKSDLRPSGAVYTPLARATLGS